MVQISAEHLLAALAVAAAIASALRGDRALRAVLGGAGAAVLAFGILRHHPFTVAAGAALALVTLARVALHASAAREGAALTAEEAQLRAHGFGAVPAAAFRQLLDEGLWINAQAGEILLREGLPVGHLFYLSEGEVLIQADGRPIATSGAGHFFGELDVLAHTPAIATIALATPGRFWCISADALDRFLRDNPTCRPALELALAGELRNKLRERSRQIVRAAAG